jgi:hypothetical protein
LAERPQSDHIYDSSGKLNSTGSANAYVIEVAEQIAGYHQGMPPIRFKANFTNSGSATANIVTQTAPSGLGAVTMKKFGGASNMASGDIVSGGMYTLIYDGAAFQVLELQPTTAAITGFPMSASGDRWGVMTPVATDGVMEIGRYLDFHNSDASAVDNANRLQTNGGTVGLYETPSGGVLKRIVSAIDSTLAQGDVLYYDGTNFVRLAPGTNGHFLKTQGAAANPLWASAASLTAGTVQATTSGTAIDFTSLPAGIKRITVILDVVSLSSTANLLVQIGDSGGIEATAYTAQSAVISGAGTSITADTTGFNISTGVATRAFSGIMTIARITGNVWVASYAGSNSATSPHAVYGGGSKTLSDELDRVRLTNTVTASNNFDAGQVNIFYE